MYQVLRGARAFENGEGDFERSRDGTGNVKIPFTEFMKRYTEEAQQEIKL
jgi:hypothetical protein